MNPISKRNLAWTTIALMGTMTLGTGLAQADTYSCRDYYAAYVDQATDPAPVVIVGIRPNYHGHYPEYHAPQGGYQGPDLHPGHNNGGQNNGGHNNNNNNSNDDADAVAAVATVAIIGGLITTSAVQDADLDDAENVINDIDQAQLGDGPQLRQLTAKVQSDMPSGKTASEAQVASLLTTDNANMSICPDGNLDSESDIASSIASTLSASPAPQGTLN